MYALYVIVDMVVILVVIIGISWNYATHEWVVLQNSCFWRFLKTMILRIPYSEK